MKGGRVDSKLQNDTTHEAGPGSFWFMFTRPVATLESLRVRSQWFLPILAGATFSVAVNSYVIRRIGWARLVNVAAQSNAFMDAEAAIQNATAHPYPIFLFQALATFLSSLLTVLAAATVVWLVLVLCGQDIPFHKVIAILAYVTALSAILRGCMLMLTTTLIRDLNAFDLRNPLATNPAFFLHPRSAVMSRLLSSLDLITFMSLTLIIVGLTKVCIGLRVRLAAMAVLIPWAIYVGTTLLLPSLLS
jgi:hypothetical protein